nr:hypothetical protein CFP56_02698 [Quercus suber]
MTRLAVSHRPLPTFGHGVVEYEGGTGREKRTIFHVHLLEIESCGNEEWTLIGIRMVVDEKRLFYDTLFCCSSLILLLNDIEIHFHFQVQSQFPKEDKREVRSEGPVWDSPRWRNGVAMVVWTVDLEGVMMNGILSGGTGGGAIEIEGLDLGLFDHGCATGHATDGAVGDATGDVAGAAAGTAAGDAGGEEKKATGIDAFDLSGATRHGDCAMSM